MDEPQDSLFPDRDERPAAGCLPLFMLPALAAFGAFLWLAPVKPSQPVKDLGRGAIDYQTGEDSDFLLSLRTPLPLRFFGTAGDEALQVELPSAKPPAMLPPPAVGGISPLPQSTILPREDMLRLPEQLRQDTTGKEPRP